MAIGPWDVFMAHSVDAYRFAPTQDRDGGATNDYPSPPYATAIACCVQPTGSQDVVDQDRVTQINMYKVYTSASLPYAIRDKLTWVDALGRSRDLLVSGTGDFTQVPLGGLVELSAIERT